ncbi:rhodanese-like domain-containing protein [Candidatus Sumerlaeota bacterium]
MTGTLYSLNLLDTGCGLAAAGLVGLLFGMFLEQAGFGSSRKLTSVFYFRDMAVIKVMFTAVVTALVGYQYLVALGWLDPSSIYVLDTYWGAQIVGGLLFGVGFVMGGWCPGTALAGMASFKLDALVFLLGAVLGSIFFNEMFALVGPLYEGGHAGAILLSDTVHVSPRILVILFAVAAAIIFSACSWIENRRASVGPESPPTRSRNRKLAVAMLILAAGTLLLPPAPPVTEAAAPAPLFKDSISAAHILREVDSAEDHIDPLDLADIIMSGRPGLMVVDIQSPETYADFHIRGAVSIPLERLFSVTESHLPKTGLIVIYSNGTTHAAQAWYALRQSGWENVRVLTDGITGFWQDCLTPPSLSGLTDEVSARKRLDAYRSRWAFFVENVVSPTPITLVAAAREEPVLQTPALTEPGLDQHLVSTQWLSEHLKDSDIRLLDVRSKSTDYTTRHIPSAVYLNLENIRATINGIPNMLAPARDLSRMFGQLSVSNGNTVIVYSDQLRDATLVAVALERIGHPNYAVLHGGWVKWTAENRAFTSDLPSPKAADYKFQEAVDKFTVDVDQVARAARDGKTVILDVRPADYYSGKKSDEPRAGHIPGAKNREYTLDLVPDTAIYKSADRLNNEYLQLGITEETPIIVHCRTGHQASQTYFLLKHILGHKDVRWFDGSWLAWSARSDLPASLATVADAK